MIDGRVNSHDEIDDGFNSFSINSGQKFDLSSKTLNQSRHVGNDTIRVLNEDRPSERNIEDAE